MARVGDIADVDVLDELFDAGRRVRRGGVGEVLDLCARQLRWGQRKEDDIGSTLELVRIRKSQRGRAATGTYGTPFTENVDGIVLVTLKPVKSVVPSDLVQLLVMVLNVLS